MKYKAIIFDMDGTIIDTEHVWKLATKKLIEQKKIILTEQQSCELYGQLTGLALPDSCLLIKQITCIEDNIQDLMREKMCLANSMYTTGIQFIKGFIEFHAKAQKLQLKMAIATNAHEDTVKVTQDALKLSDYFGSHIYCVSHVKNPKPNPDIYLHAAKNIEIDPSECIAIEDSAPGITAAKTAGMFCIGINTAKRPDTLKDAHLVINNYEELTLPDYIFKKEK
ncbi:MAG: HAD family phosphatase [Candidatus Dependentiae bacterium]